MTTEFEEKLWKIITLRLNSMPNYKEYMVNSTMKVLLPPDIKQLFLDTFLKLLGESKTLDEVKEKIKNL